MTPQRLALSTSHFETTVFRSVAVKNIPHLFCKEPSPVMVIHTIVQRIITIRHTIKILRIIKI